jgi:hypothetical protein
MNDRIGDEKGTVGITKRKTNKKGGKRPSVRPSSGRWGWEWYRQEQKTTKQTKQRIDTVWRQDPARSSLSKTHTQRKKQSKIPRNKFQVLIPTVPCPCPPARVRATPGPFSGPGARCSNRDRELTDINQGIGSMSPRKKKGKKISFVYAGIRRWL